MDSNSLKDETIKSLGSSNLSPEEKAKIAKDIFATLKDTPKDSTDKVQTVIDYIKSIFIPTWGIFIGINRISDGDNVNGWMCIILSIISIILTIYSLSFLFKGGSQTGLNQGTINQYIKTYKSINQPISQ